MILLLPPDASGPGVHTGPLPMVSAAASGTAAAAPAVSPVTAVTGTPAPPATARQCRHEMAADCCRLGGRPVRELAERLGPTGVEAAMLGDAIGAPMPAGCRRIGSMAESATATAGVVVFCAAARMADREQARRLRTESAGRMVPILLGEVPRSRWLIRVGPDTIVPSSS